MIENVAIPSSTAIFFTSYLLTNFFTSRDLLLHLKSKKSRASGTVRENRVAKCPLLSSSVMKKKKRGTYDFSYDQNGDVLYVKWNDNKCVILGTNFDTIKPINYVTRWDKIEKAEVKVPQPDIVKNYTSYMGGVDHHDWLLGKYCIRIRGKKWYWPLFTRMIDMSMINAWIIHKLLSEDNATDLLAFRRKVAVEYLKIDIGRSSVGRPLKRKLENCIRYDGIDHLIVVRTKQRRCQNKPCSKKPTTYCQKCDSTLCVTCFAPYH